MKTVSVFKGSVYRQGKRFVEKVWSGKGLEPIKIENVKVSTTAIIGQYLH